jgi:uncharacterized protein YneF (UPF0154 family)
MKFSTFFGKYTICSLIYTLVSMVLGIAGFGVLYHIGKKAEKESLEDDPMITEYMKRNSSK